MNRGQHFDDKTRKCAQEKDQKKNNKEKKTVQL